MLSFTEIIIDLLRSLETFLRDPVLLFLGSVVLGQYLVYQFLNKKFRSRDQLILTGVIPHHQFSEKYTMALQRFFGTRGKVARLSSAYYVFGFGICTFLSIPIFISVLVNQAITRLWIYLLITAVMWFVDIAVFWLYPVGPPVRVSKNPEYNHFRAHYFPWSDKVIGIYHNALPSGHIWSLVLFWVASLVEGMWEFFIFYSINLIIASFVIIYTGDHYPIDIVASFLFVTGLYIFFWILITSFGL